MSAASFPVRARRAQGSLGFLVARYESKPGTPPNASCTAERDCVGRAGNGGGRRIDVATALCGGRVTRGADNRGSG